jgi:hypothetical protein
MYGCAYICMFQACLGMYILGTYVDRLIIKKTLDPIHTYNQDYRTYKFVPFEQTT